MPTATKTKEDAKTENKPKPTDAKPPKPSGKEETRLFQRPSHERVWLTKEQAQDEGFFWNRNANV